MIAGATHQGAWPTLLIVDSDSEMLRTLVCFFEKRGFHVAAGTTLAEARAFLQRRKAWTLVISDYHLPDGTGLELLGWVREQAGATTPVLLMSGSAHAATLCAGVDYLAKPFPLAALETRVRTMLGRMSN
jgi:two-component system response regulator PilR (NtrC family)